MYFFLIKKYMEELLLAQKVHKMMIKIIYIYIYIYIYKIFLGIHILFILQTDSKSESW